jgi:hypothetical protein
MQFDSEEEIEERKKKTLKITLAITIFVIAIKILQGII